MEEAELSNDFQFVFLLSHASPPFPQLKTFFSLRSLTSKISRTIFFQSSTKINGKESFWIDLWDATDQISFCLSSLSKIWKQRSTSRGGGHWYIEGGEHLYIRVFYNSYCQIVIVFFRIFLKFLCNKWSISSCFEHS